MATQTIDGKIFQLKNAAGTENRFPRTVMEAVYGLNTYLQEQFAGLADLYEEKGYVAYNATTKVLTVGGVSVDLANLSDYYTKTQADGRYLKLTGGTLTGQLIGTIASLLTLGVNRNESSGDIRDSTKMALQIEPYDNRVQFKLFNPTNATILGLYANGYVGIGTQASPNYKLTVIGSIGYTGQLVSTVATGTSPLSVTSTTLNANLNADLLDGKHLSEILASNVASATKINETSREDEEFVFQATPVHDINDGFRLDSIKGRTLAWNQKANVADMQQQTISGITVSVVNGIISLNGTASSNGNIYFDSFSAKPLVANHKYYLFARTNIGQYEYAARVTGGEFIFDRNISTSEIITASGNADAFYSSFRWYNGNVFNNVKVFVPKCIDLTLMFGAGNEPSTVAEFEAMFPEAYYPYNEGTLISNDASEIETVGFNQWDEEWESGVYAINGGQKVVNSQYIRCKNLIPVFPNTTYYKRAGVGASDFSLCFYDANKQFIQGSQPGINTDFTTPDNCYYISFYINTGTPATYNHNICINLSDASKNGTYEPYWKRTINLGLNAIKVKSHNIWDEEWEQGSLFNDGTPDNYSVNQIRNKGYISISANSSYYFYNGTNTWVVYYYDVDKNFISLLNIGSGGVFTTPANCYYLRFRGVIGYGSTYNNDICINLSSSFNGNYEPHGILTKTGGLKGAGSAYNEKSDKYYERVGEVDLGDLSWTSYPYSSDFLTFRCSFAHAASLNAICSKYQISSETAAINQKNKTIMTRANTTTLYIRDDAYSTAEAFKAAMSGVMLYYELATPIEYELAEPMPMTGKIDGYGTMRRIGASEPSAPFRADITYGLNPGQTASDLSALVASIYRDTLRINGLDVAGIATIAGGVKLTDTKKIWFDDTHYLELKDGYLHTNLPIVSDSYITAGAVNS